VRAFRSNKARTAHSFGEQPSEPVRQYSLNGFGAHLSHPGTHFGHLGGLLFNRPTRVQYASINLKGAMPCETIGPISSA
jgi:hypothetical protein